MILLADMPGVETKMINLLMDRYLDSGLPVGAISAAGRAVHPVIFSAALYPEIRRLKGDVGARSILKANWRSHLYGGTSGRLRLSRRRHSGGLP